MKIKNFIKVMEYCADDSTSCCKCEFNSTLNCVGVLLKLSKEEIERLQKLLDEKCDIIKELTEKGR